jgi:hypothetical protein
MDSLLEVDDSSVIKSMGWISMDQGESVGEVGGSGGGTTRGGIRPVICR